MSSDPTQFPGVPKSVSPAQGPRASSIEGPVRIIELPQDLRETRITQRVRGQVIKATRDLQTNETVVRVRTERGDIEVRIPENQKPPKEGQRVELEIRPQATPGRAQQAPPENAIIRPAPPEEAAPAPRPISTPVEVIVRPPGETPPPVPPVDAAPVPPWPQPGSEVRLQPLPPEEAARIQAEFFPEIASATISKIEIVAQVIATEAPEKIAAQVLALKSTPAQTAFIASFMPAGTPPENPAPVIVPPPLVKTGATPQVLTVTPLPQPILTPSFAIPAQPITTSAPGDLPALPADALPRAQSTDIRIESVTPPEAVVTAPGSGKPKILEALLNEQKIPAILKNNDATTLTGVITGTTKQNLPVLSVFLPQIGGVQSFAVQAPVQTLEPPLASGTQITFTPQTLPGAATMPTGLQPLPPFSYFLTPEPWPVMDDIYRTLAAIAPSVAQAMTQIAPSPANPAQLTPAALFFIAAIRGGDINGWLGDKAIEALKRDPRGGGLLARLTQESGLLSRMAGEPVSQDWRAIPLPLYWQGEFQKISLYFKQDSEGQQQDGEKGDGARFIFDLNLTNMGKVQIDGLFRPTRLDLVLRSEQSFSSQMMMDMRATYAKALRQTELTGELSFQNQPSQWVMITPDQKNFGASA